MRDDTKNGCVADYHRKGLLITRLLCVLSLAQAFCLTVRVYLNTQKYELFCSLIDNYCAEISLITLVLTLDTAYWKFRYDSIQSKV